MTIREQTEMRQARDLSPHACLSQNSRGRLRPTPDCPIRTSFARDRDRVIHSKAFRDLMYKTQVFLAFAQDDYRTRLTHTLEVSQIARTLAIGLSLNEELTEAISLGHDLGHTPFGHAGEHALKQVCTSGFSHALQSVRVVEKLENSGKGLNLTFEVKNGIACHSFSNPSEDGMAKTWEGRVVWFADKIAYLNHDLEDAMQANVLTDVPWTIQYALGRDKSARITTLITSLITNSIDDVCMDSATSKAFYEFHDFMYSDVYHSPPVAREEERASDIVKRLYDYFVAHPDEMPQEYGEIREKEGVERAVCDYISRMSDRAAVAIFESLFIPHPWRH